MKISYFLWDEQEIFLGEKMRFCVGINSESYGKFWIGYRESKLNKIFLSALTTS